MTEEEIIMFQCHVCGSTTAERCLVHEFFQIEGKPVLVERIPALVCMRCGEETFSRDTMECIRRMVHGEAKPEKSIAIDGFAFA